jgi:hypothetical protein
VATASWGKAKEGGPANPQDLNRYAYVLNNPVRHTDPTGHDVDCLRNGMPCGSVTNHSSKPVVVRGESGNLTLLARLQQRTHASMLLLTFLIKASHQRTMMGGFDIPPPKNANKPYIPKELMGS